MHQLVKSLFFEKGGFVVILKQVVIIYLKKSEMECNESGLL